MSGLRETLPFQNGLDLSPDRFDIERGELVAAAAVVGGVVALKKVV